MSDEKRSSPVQYSNENGTGHPKPIKFGTRKGYLILIRHLQYSNSTVINGAVTYTETVQLDLGAVLSVQQFAN